MATKKPSAGTPAGILTTTDPPGRQWAGVYGSDGPKAIGPGKCPSDRHGSARAGTCHIGG
ncbi:MAG: hypothetical protein KIT54_07450 [Phycisphaeraceae bacterium]|nr:hypothetical protein [Phycisphaeraceae bacterium]